MAGLERRKYSNIPDRDKDVGGGIGLNVLGRGSEDETNNPDKQTDSHTLRTTPEIQRLGQGQLGKTTDDAGDDTDGSAQRMLSKRTGHKGVQAASDDFGGRGSEVDEPDSVKLSVTM